MTRLVLICACALALLLANTAAAQTGPLTQPDGIEYAPLAGDGLAPGAVTQSQAYPDGDFYEQLRAAGGDSACGPSSPNWGCGGSPFRTGPGKCDRWRVGPMWRVSLDGIFMTRDETDLDRLAANIGTTLATAEQSDNFEHGGGARLLLTSHWPQMKGYEMQVGYVGIFDWDASVVTPLTNVAVPPVGSVALQQIRSLDYNSDLHSVEINAQRLTSSTWKPYGGVRYIQFEENITDFNDQFNTVPLGIGETAITNDVATLANLENHLIGFQLGVRQETWQLTRKLSLRGFASGGAYCNFIDRDERNAQTQTVTEILVDDPATPTVDESGNTDITVTQTGSRTRTSRTEPAFVGEGSLALVYTINRCCALHAGYQAMWLNGLEFADDAYLNLPPDREDLLMHGWFGGFEYRR